MDPRKLLQSMADIAEALGLEVVKTQHELTVKIPEQPGVNYCWCGCVEEIHDGTGACLKIGCDCKLWSPRGIW